jgi:3-methyl-2-oxobutanoate hydroxymethyltransferase
MPNTERPVRIPDIKAMKARDEKIVMLTAYDAWMARILAASGMVDMLLVGDSLGMVELGYDNTIPVTMNDVVRHTRAVRAGAPRALIVADMPFLSHRIDAATTMQNAGRLVQKGGATAVKLEGGIPVADSVERIVTAGIPVMGHLGLQPQSMHAAGGFRRQFTRPEEQRQLKQDAAALQQAGAFAIVLECVPDDLAREVTGSLRIPIIGIGSGPHCDGQVLVTHDMLGISGAQAPPFARRYAQLGDEIQAAVTSFAREVRTGVFPQAVSRPAVNA